MANEYLIYPADARWGIRWQGRTLATFPEKPQAIRAAIALAQATGEQGVSAAVLAQGEQGTRYTLWAFGRDGYVSEA